MRVILKIPSLSHTCLSYLRHEYCAQSFHWTLTLTHPMNNHSNSSFVSEAERATVPEVQTLQFSIKPDVTFSSILVAYFPKLVLFRVLVFLLILCATSLFPEQPLSLL